MATTNNFKEVSCAATAVVVVVVVVVVGNPFLKSHSRRLERRGQQGKSQRYFSLLTSEGGKKAEREREGEKGERE